MVALTPGERVVLRSSFPATGAGLVQRDGGNDRFDVLELRAAPTLTDSPELPDHLAAVPALPARTAVRTRTFELAEHHINGRKMDPRRIDAGVGKDTPRSGRCAAATAPCTPSTCTTCGSRSCRSTTGSRPRNRRAGRTGGLPRSAATSLVLQPLLPDPTSGINGPELCSTAARRGPVGYSSRCRSEPASRTELTRESGT